MTKKLMIWILMILILASTALALSKPIAGKINGAVGAVELFVEVDFVGSSETCVVNPTIETGSTGDFATNLANLVFQDSPQTRCDGFWKIGDNIWYEFNGQKSEVQQIATGTGLQYLQGIIVIGVETPSSGGSGGSSSEKETIILELEKSVTLTAEQNQDLIEALLKIKLSSDLNKNLKAKVLLTDFFNNKVIEFQEENFFLANEFAKSYLFNLKDLEPGQYKIQAFVYDDQELIGVSNAVKFTLTPPEQAALESPQPLTERTQFPISWYVVLIFAILILVLIIWWLKKK